MQSEKVKEIKIMLEDCQFFTIRHHPKIGEPMAISFADILTLINELESENERLKEYRKNYSGTVARLKSENERLKQSNKNILFVNELVIKQNEKLKDQIAELENGIAQSMLGCEFLPECTDKKLKQFAERLKKKKRDVIGNDGVLHIYGQGVFVNDIDETLKEFMEIEE